MGEPTKVKRDHSESATLLEMAAKVPDSTKQNVVIVLVPGSFNTPEIFTDFSKRLTSDGYSVHDAPLLSACPPNKQRQPSVKMEDDARYIHEVVEGVLSTGKDVVVLAVSFGGIPAMEALKGIASSSSLTSGSGSQRRGAVVGLFALSTYLPSAGDSVRSIMGDLMFEPWKTGVPGGYLSVPSEAAQVIFYEWTVEGSTHDEDTKRWFGTMVTQSSDSFDGKVTYDAWSEDGFKGQVVYVMGELDHVVPPSLAESMIKRVEDQAGEGRVEVVRVADGGHMMHITRVDTVVEVLENLLGRLQG